TPEVIVATEIGTVAGSDMGRRRAEGAGRIGKVAGPRIEVKNLRTLTHTFTRGWSRFQLKIDGLRAGLDGESQAGLVWFLVACRNGDELADRTQIRNLGVGVLHFPLTLALEASFREHFRCRRVGGEDGHFHVADRHLFNGVMAVGVDPARSRLAVRTINGDSAEGHGRALVDDLARDGSRATLPTPRDGCQQKEHGHTISESSLVWEFPS